MINANVKRRIFVLGVSLLFISCTGIGSWIQRSHCPVVPVPTGDLPDDVNLRAHMHFSIEDREAHFEVVARRVPEELVVVGIAQYGVRLFAARQRGREIAVEGTPSREFAHLARWTLDALHRAIWIPTQSDPGAGPVVSWSWENESVKESIHGGRRRREFERSGASEPVVIRYDPLSAGAGPRVEVQNPWCGYAVTFTIIDTPDGAVQ
jgi:hypothetical protein